MRVGVGGLAGKGLRKSRQVSSLGASVAQYVNTVAYKRCFSLFQCDKGTPIRFRIPHCLEILIF